MNPSVVCRNECLIVLIAGCDDWGNTTQHNITTRDYIERNIRDSLMMVTP